MESNVCPKCNGTGRVTSKNGGIEPCFDCLMGGKLDQHNKNVKTSGFSIPKIEGNQCQKCNGTGRVMDKKGTIGPCFDCLREGRFDQHNKNIKSAEDLRIKL